MWHGPFCRQKEYVDSLSIWARVIQWDLLNVPFTSCTKEHTHKDGAQGKVGLEHCPAATNKHLTQSSPHARAWTQFPLPFHLCFTLSHGSSALYQCHSTTFHFDIITSVRAVYVALCTLKVCSFSKLKAQHTESYHANTDIFPLTAKILLCSERNEKLSISTILYWKTWKHAIETFW